MLFDFQCLVEATSRFVYAKQTPDLDEVKESVRQGVTKVAGKLSTMANNLSSIIQVCAQWIFQFAESKVSSRIRSRCEIAKKKMHPSSFRGNEVAIFRDLLDVDWLNGQ